MSTLTQFTGGGIKSIQRGTITLSLTLTATATISSVNVNKSMLNFLGCVDNTGFTTNLGFARIELTNATTITASRGTGTSGSSVVAYEVIEYN